MNLDDGNPNAPGSDVQIFNGTGITTDRILANAAR